MMNKLITLVDKPSLKNPCLIAAWPGMGNVALTTINYMKEKLDTRVLGEIDPADFFAPTGAVVTKQVIRPPEMPTNQFFYYQSKDSNNDIILFLGSIQPIPHREYEFAKLILKLAQSFGVKMVYTAAAAPSDMHFKNTPRVFAVPNHRDLTKQLMSYKVHFMSDGNIAGLNGLLISVAGEMDMKGICLLGEIPFFTAQIEYPRASLMVMEILTKLINIEIDLVDLELYANQKEKEIEPLAALLTKDKFSSSGMTGADSQIIPDSESKVPKSAQLKIEKLFRQAEFDRTYKNKMRLKEELDKWGLFDDYLDRFLDLFKKDREES